MFIGVIPLSRDPIFMTKCPHARNVGLVHIAWTELKFVRSSDPKSTDAVLHANYSEGDACSTLPGQARRRAARGASSASRQRVRSRRWMEP
jgi:hypothetical protein